VATPQIDTRRLFDIGRRLFDDGGIEALETVIDAVYECLGCDAVADLTKVWGAVIKGYRVL
jgi:hypothetical protein